MMQSWFPYCVGLAVGFAASRLLTAIQLRQAEARVERLREQSTPPESTPVVQQELNIVYANVDRLTRMKADSLTQDGGKITGFIITFEKTRDYGRAVVELGAVRWMSKDEMWELMHPTPVTSVQPKIEEPVRGYCASMITAEQIGAYSNPLREDDPTEGWYQTRFDFTRIRSAADTIVDLKELVDLTVWQQDTVERAAVWLSGLAEVGDIWWTQFIECVDTLDVGDNEGVRERLIEMVGQVVATPVDAL